MIEVVDYDPRWPDRFDALRSEYAAAMRAAGVPVVAIEHVGSTSVPGLAAKPVIDCDIVVEAPHVEAASRVLVNLGFIPLGELGIARRWAFREPARLAGTHTYVVEEGSLALRNHRAVRDLLRTDAALRDAYGRVKQQVASQVTTIDEYGQGKSPILSTILAAAGLTDAEVAEVAGQQVPPHEGPTGGRPPVGAPGVTPLGAGTVTVLDDAAIVRHLSAGAAVRWMGEAVDAHHRGELVAPPRVHTELGESRLVFTTGQLQGAWFGYRSYSTFPGEPGAQVVVVHGERDGRVRAIAVGNELGPRRVGAIGGVAAEALAPHGPATVAVIGSGLQASMQLWALAAVRRVEHLRVYSRDRAHREAFAATARSLIDGDATAVDDPRSAVDGAGIVIVATSSATPVLEASWLEPGAYVTTLGPKQQGRAEFGLDLAEAASVLVTDSPDQIAAYDPPNVLAGTPHQARLVSLGSVRAGEAALPVDPHLTVFFSVGLAGTEAFLLDRLAADLAARNAG